MFRLWLLRLLPFLGRWFEAAPMCCGACPTCATTAATGIALDVIGTKPRKAE